MSEIENHRDPITLTRFILKEQQEVRAAGGHVTGSFAMLLQSIQLAVKVIANASTKAGIANLYGVAGSENKSGDQQKKLDVFSNDVFINAIKFSEQVYVMCSEENEEAIVCDKNSGGYAVVFDPLDGSSNIDANVSVGTIFGIYARDPTHGETSDRDLLKKGSKLICGGYALYGSCVMLVLTTGRGVNGFSLDPSLGEFILTHKNIRIPLDGKIFSVNEGNFNNFSPSVKEYIELCKKRAYKARYVGSMVADVHRTLLYGGIFLYPADKKNKTGKLRLLYECNPMAFLMEQAGGMCSTGSERMLDVQPTKLHERRPIVMGSLNEFVDINLRHKSSAL